MIPILCMLLIPTYEKNPTTGFRSVLRAIAYSGDLLDRCLVAEIIILCVINYSYVEDLRYTSERKESLHLPNLIERASPAIQEVIMSAKIPKDVHAVA